MRKLLKKLDKITITSKLKNEKNLTYFLPMSQNRVRVFFYQFNCNIFITWQWYKKSSSNISWEISKLKIVSSRSFCPTWATEALLNCSLKVHSPFCRPKIVSSMNPIVYWRGWLLRTSHQRNKLKNWLLMNKCRMFYLDNYLAVSKKKS